MMQILQKKNNQIGNSDSFAVISTSSSSSSLDNFIQPLAESSSCLFASMFCRLFSSSCMSIFLFLHSNSQKAIQYLYFVVDKSILSNDNFSREVTPYSILKNGKLKIFALNNDSEGKHGK